MDAQSQKTHHEHVDLILREGVGKGVGLGNKGCNWREEVRKSHKAQITARKTLIENDRQTHTKQ